MNSSVLDILIYVFDRYMLEDSSDVPERDDLARDLELAGFTQATVERALDWLADLAGDHERPDVGGTGPSLRIYADGELSRLSTECRGFLLTLERLHVLSAHQREIVIERMLALDADELDTEQLKWVTLLVLSSQPGQEQAVARMENIVLEHDLRAPH